MSSARALGEDVRVPPCWRVRTLDPASSPSHADEALPPGTHVLRLEAGVGFGTGEHPSTQLCLQAIGYLARSGAPLATVLDVGAGSGILSIAAALLGATVEAVEIDEPSIAHARVNARHNGVEAHITLHTACTEPPRPFDLVAANILRPVLVALAEVIAARVAPRGRLVLAGLLATDVPFILARYRALLPAHRPDIYERGEWRAVMFSPV